MRTMQIAYAAMCSPSRALAVMRARLKGHWFRLRCRLTGVRFECGRNLRLHGNLSIVGPGRVRFGDNVVVDMTVTPWTYDTNAVIEVGDGTYLNGTRFGCARSIIIGPRSIVAQVSIMDTNFHSTKINRHDRDAPVRVASVQIGANVWIGAQAGILPGTTIGDNSVVGFGAVCSGNYPSNSLIAAPRAEVVRRWDESH